MLLSILPLLLFSFSPTFAVDPTIDVSIQTPSGNATIRGYAHPYGNSWRGIPYAAAPLGKNRFVNAIRRDPSGLLSALSYGSPCIQPAKGSEDCLFLNVFTAAKTPLSARLPVFVYIHGGGFYEGDGNMGAGIYRNLVARGPMVMVSINYRLGPFGFFSTRDPMAPGNFAVSDWIEALQWVQRYISFFGGDPSRVTVGGHSSGAEAVSLLSMTDRASGLYTQLIIESGSAFSAAVMSYSEKTRNTSEQLAESTRCAEGADWKSGSDFGPILNCLRSLPAEKISTADAHLPNHRMKWGPVADRFFFPQRFEFAAMGRPPYPVLIGDVHDEWLAWEENNIEKHLNNSDNSQNGLKNSLASSYEMTYWENKAAILVSADNEYITNEPYQADDHVNWMTQRIKLYSEMVFIGPVLRDAKYFQYTGSNVYLYSFDYLSPLALPSITNPALRGVPHGWELQYIYDSSCSGYNCTSNDEAVREYASTMWTNFILTGNPTPVGSNSPIVWPKLDSTNRFATLSRYPSISLSFHPSSLFWACTAPTMDGYKPPNC